MKKETARYKLYNGPLNSLSTLQVLTLLIGNTNEDHEVAKTIYKDCQNNLIEVSSMQKEDFLRYKGIGNAVASRLVAAFELGKRRNLSIALERPQITKSKDCFDIMHPHFQGLDHEEMWVAVLNRANKVIKIFQHSSGGISGSVVDTTLLFQTILRVPRVNGIILSHNHPSGNLTPSQADLDITQKIIDAAKVLNISVLDHLILSEDSYLSFADQGYI